MKNAVTEMFGIDVPIFAFTHCRDVVAAVSKAGGLGVLGAVGLSPRQMEIDLQWIEDEVGDKPYGVDLIIPAKYAGDRSRAAMSRPRDLIQHHPRVNIGSSSTTSSRSYDVPPMPEREEDEAARGVRAGWTAFGAAPFSANAARCRRPRRRAREEDSRSSPTPSGRRPQHMIDAVARSAGVRTVGALAGQGPSHAEAARQRAGVDIIIAQGSEAGGHTGEIGTMVLIPEIVDAVLDTPVLGAGGIGRGRQMAAAMALGAQGVWCGSVWLTTEEAETHPVVKEKMLGATSSDTVRSRSRTGKPARQLKSAWTEEWENPETPMPLGMPLQPVLIDEAISRINRAAHREGSGAEQLANYFVGQIVGSMNKSKSASQVVYEMIEEFLEATEGLTTQING